MLLGVTLVAARTVQFDRIDPEHSRELFIRHALVERDWHHQAPVLRREPAGARRGRRAGRNGPGAATSLIDDDTMFALYDARIPAEVTSGPAFRLLVEEGRPGRNRTC